VEAYAALCEAAQSERNARRARLDAAADAAFDSPITTPLVAAREMARAIGPDIAIVDEAVATSLHLRGFLNSNSTRRYSFSRGGALGWGMPAVVGYSLGIDRAPVVSIVGNGAALYSPQALWTAAYEKLPVTFVVINNREYNVLKNFMKSQAHFASARANRFIAMDLVDPDIDFWRSPPQWACRHAGSTAPARSLRRWKAGIASHTANLVDIPVSADH
jgi:benzoylformate decarboxylase